MNSRHYKICSFLHRTLLFCALYIIHCTLYSCANRGIGPQGGPKDTTPPVPVKSEPENGSVNFSGSRIEVTFNEYIQLDNIATNLLMSPPQQTPPEVKARGKRLLVHFVDSLRDSTTYTLDFGAAVCDYTEKNPLRGYSFAFSTGDIIDTLELRGRLYNAENLNPMPDILVGIHSNRHDSAFVSEPFLRIAKTDSAGHWRIGNMRDGLYRLYAIDDVSRDYRFNIGEGLAFTEELFMPEIPPMPLPAAPDSAVLDSMARDSMVIDSMTVDSTVVDTIPQKAEPVLMFFREQRKRLYLQRTLRDEQHRISLLFSASPDSLPTIRAMRPSEIDSTRSDSAWIDPLPYMRMLASPHGDTLNYWLIDSVAIRQDSIFLEARYRRTDSVYQYEWYTDTLRAVWRAPKLTQKAREAQERQRKNRRLELKCNARQTFELYDTLALSCQTPIDTIRVDSLHLFERVDSVVTPVAFTMDSLRIIANLQAGKNYELRVDSGAVTDIYGVSNFAYTFKLKLKTPEDYSTLRVKIMPFDEQLRIQVLNNKDAVVRELPATAEGAFFQYLKPDTYYLRCYMDWNGDGQWTTGSWDEKRQPEPVYYYPQKIQTKSNWDFEEEWDYTAVPQMESKPKELIKVEVKKK